MRKSQGARPRCAGVPLPTRAVPRAALLLAVLLPPALLAGCAQKASVGDCGLLVHVPSRPIDEGTRYDVREQLGQPAPLAEVRYTFKNGTDVVYDGTVADLLASGGNRSLRFLDVKNDSLLDVPDAFVTLDQGPYRLTLSHGSTILGGSFGCEE